MTNPCDASKHTNKGIRILRSSVRVLADKGMEGTKIEEVARRAGVGKGTVYQYFDSKKALFEAAVEYATGIYGQTIIDALGEGADLSDSLCQAMRAAMQFADRYRPAAQILLNNPGGQPMESFQKPSLKLRRALTHCLKTTLARHQEETADWDQEAAINVILGTLTHLTLTRLLEEQGDQLAPIDHVATATLPVLLHGLRGPKT